MIKGTRSISYRVLPILVVGMFLSGLIYADETDPISPINDVIVDSNNLNIGAEEKVNLIYVLEESGTVNIEVYSIHGGYEGRLVINEYQEAGPQGLVWDGKMWGKEVKEGIYYFVITLLPTECNDCELVRYEPQSSIPEIVIKDFDFDKESGTIAYQLTCPAQVKIRAGLRNGGPMLAEIITGDIQGAGFHEESWDIPPEINDLVDRENFGFNQEVIPLPDNAVQVVNGSPSKRAAPAEIDFRLEEVGTSAPGEVQVKVELDAPSRRALLEKRYEIISYIDGKFVNEEENGTSPYRVVIPTRKLNPGRHIVTVNVATLDGEIGSKNMEIDLE